MNDPTTTTEPIVRVIGCEIHGSRRWKMHIICDECGRVFQTSDPTKPLFPPAVCKCGARLAPPGEPEKRIGDWLDRVGVALVTDADIDNPDSLQAFTAAAAVPRVREHMDSSFDHSEWSARPICYVCFRKIARNMDGRIPNYVKPPRVN